MSIGSNNVENHPLSSRWVERAQDRGATWIVVDPRFTRSAAQADIYGRIRPGSDLAFYGGLINYILSKKLYHRDYIVAFTNAAWSTTRKSGIRPTARPSRGFVNRACPNSRRPTSRS